MVAVPWIAFWIVLGLTVAAAGCSSAEQDAELRATPDAAPSAAQAGEAIRRHLLSTEPERPVRSLSGCRKLTPCPKQRGLDA
jgi:hypothetical protein